MQISAPGKVLLCGEYAVLEGAPALVAAIQRRVKVYHSQEVFNRSSAKISGSPQAPARTSEVVLAQRLALEHVGNAASEQQGIHVDSTELYFGTSKLGLGSSAAASVAMTGFVFANAHKDLHDAQTRQTLFELADKAHRSVAPLGSGIDVAASVWGGFLEATRNQGVLRVKPLKAPKNVHMRVIWTGTSARTHQLISQVKQQAAQDVRGYETHLMSLAVKAEQFIEAWQSSENIVETANHYADALAQLGHWAHAPIETPVLSAIRALARTHDGSAKPSGAGGGDVAVAFFTASTHADAFTRDCKQQGWLVLEAELGAPGVQTDKGSV